MAILETENYRLSANIEGPEDSPRLALIQPGFCEAWQYPHMRAYVKRLSKLGCLAISYNAPGIWGSRVREDSLYRGNPFQMQGYSAFRQVDAAREIIEERKKINPGIKITSIGHSLGGMLAIYVAALFKENVDSLILDRAPYTWTRESNRKSRSEWNESGVRVLYKRDTNRLKAALGIKAKLEINREFTQYAHVYDGKPLIQRLPVEKLQIAGTLDELVVLSEVEEDFAIAAEPKELIKTETDHCYLSLADVLRNARTAKRFSFIPEKRPYSNGRVIKQNMDIVADWMERKGLIPH